MIFFLSFTKIYLAHLSSVEIGQKEQATLHENPTYLWLRWLLALLCLLSIVIDNCYWSA